MKKLGEHSLFVINAILITGLIGLGFWLQQNGTAIIPVPPTAPNGQPISAASNTVANAPVTAQNNSATASTSSTAASPPKTNSTAPVVRRPPENESGERYSDE
jgi:cytoskeletal protein RodZ